MSDSNTSNGEFSQDQSGALTEELIDLFIQLQNKVVLPSQLKKPPNPVGQKKAGKWKAHQWYTLFQYIVPLVLPEMFVKDHLKISTKSSFGLILVNAGALCRCTSIVCEKAISPNDPEIFELHYKRYGITSKQLFQNVNVRPNHHYALHIPQMLRRWGPLHGVAEFSGERFIGFLQKVKTNNKTNEINRTMMWKVCSRQRLMTAHEPAPKLKPSDIVKEHQEEISLSHQEYATILKHVQRDSPNLRDFEDLPHPKNSEVFFNYVQEFQTWKWCGADDIERIVSVGSPNGGVVYKEGGRLWFGIVKKIYRMKTSKNALHIQLIITKIKGAYDDHMDSYASTFRSILSLFKAYLGIVTSKSVIVSLSQLNSLFAYRKLKNNVFGIAEDGIICRPVEYTSFIHPQS